MEEPENGIHAERIGAMIRLLRDIAVDPELTVDGVKSSSISTHRLSSARFRTTPWSLRCRSNG